MWHVSNTVLFLIILFCETQVHNYVSMTSHIKSATMSESRRYRNPPAKFTSNVWKYFGIPIENEKRLFVKHAKVKWHIPAEQQICLITWKGTTESTLCRKVIFALLNILNNLIFFYVKNLTLSYISYFHLLFYILFIHS
jgi:hypothetical protein